MTLFVEAKKILGCVYVDWLGAPLTPNMLTEIEEALREVNLREQQGEDDKAMLIIGPGLQNCIGGLAIGRSGILRQLEYSGICLEMPSENGPRSFVIDDGCHIAFKAGSHIPVGMLIKDSGRANQNHEELLEAAWKEWNQEWDKMLEQTNS